MPPETRRQAERFSVQRVRCRTAIKQEARGFEVASIDGEHERQAKAPRQAGVALQPPQRKAQLALRQRAAVVVREPSGRGSSVTETASQRRTSSVLLGSQRSG